METRPVRRGEAAGLRDLRLRALRDAPHAYFASLAVAENSRAAKALYRSLGFVPTGERRSMASDPTRVGIFMARRL